MRSRLSPDGHHIAFVRTLAAHFKRGGASLRFTAIAGQQGAFVSFEKWMERRHVSRCRRATPTSLKFEPLTAALASGTWQWPARRSDRADLLYRSLTVAVNVIVTEDS